MTGEHDSTLRKTLFVDPARHPLLAQWLEANPYYWADSLRDLAEAEIAAGRLQILLGKPSRTKKKKPRGATLVPAQARDLSPKDKPAAAPRASGGASGSGHVPSAPQSAAPVRATSHASEQPPPPPPVVQGAVEPSKRTDSAHPAHVAGNAIASSGDMPEKLTPENTYAPEPAQTKAEPGATETANAQPDSPEELLKAIARRQLLGNNF